MIYFTSDCFLQKDDRRESQVIKAWNKRVGIGDVVYHLGDFTALNFEFAAKTIEKLNGEIHFLPGSNDFWMKGMSKNLIRSVRSATGETCSFESPIVSVETGFGYRRGESLPIVLCHYPMTIWDRSYLGSLHAFGHSCGRLAWRAPRSIDVGFDVFSKPVNINDIIKWFKERSEI